MCYTPGEDSDTLGQSESVCVAAGEDGGEDECEDAGSGGDHVHDADVRLLRLGVGEVPEEKLKQTQN